MFLLNNTYFSSAEELENLLMSKENATLSFNDMELGEVFANTLYSPGTDEYSDEFYVFFKTQKAECPHWPMKLFTFLLTSGTCNSPEHLFRCSENVKELKVLNAENDDSARRIYVERSGERVVRGRRGFVCIPSDVFAINIGTDQYIVAKTNFYRLESELI